MDARKGNIFEILNGNKQFIIPVYQRYYSWGEEPVSYTHLTLPTNSLV